MRLRNSFARRWELSQFFWRPDRPLHKFSAAVRAVPAGQSVVAAIGTESAFERADNGILGIWRQILVAAFAIGFEDQHHITTYPMDSRPVNTIDMAR